jgi:hypothetical protein
MQTSVMAVMPQKILVVLKGKLSYEIKNIRLRN